MANYNEQTGEGQSWQRAYKVSIDNPYNGVPSITFYEEMVVKVGTNLVHQPVTSCTVQFEPNKEFQIINPANNVSTGGTLTHKDLYTYLYSLYIDTATKRDAPSSGII